MMKKMSLRRNTKEILRLILILAVFIEGASATVISQSPSLVVDPQSGPPGSIVQATGEGFLESPCEVKLYLDSTSGPLLASSAVEDGTFSASLEIPEDVAPGGHRIVAQGRLFAGEFCGGPSGEQASAAFLVIPPASPRFDFNIYLKNRIIGADCEIDQELLDIIHASPRATTHAIVQLWTLPEVVEQPRVVQTGAGFASLPTPGITLLDYLNGIEGPGTAYFAAIPRDVQADQPQFHELVRCLVPLEPGDKIEAGLEPEADTSILVRFFGDVSDEEVRAVFQGQGLRALPRAPGLWQTSASRGQIEALAAEDPVQWIEAGPLPFMPMADDVRASSNVDAVQGLDPVSGVYSGLSGAGVQVGIMDTGVDNEHNDFALRILHSKDDTAAHGTHVAGIAVASGVQSDKTNDDGVSNGGTAFQWRGVAPEAGINAYDGAAGNAAIYSDAINIFGTDVSNHSYGMVNQGEYSADVASVDAIIRGDSPGVPARALVFAAGNNASVEERDCDDDGNNDGFFPQYPWPDPPGPCPVAYQAGYFSVLSPCKNCINVASVSKALIHSSSSSMGPTMDGRLKPEIAAIGEDVMSAAPNTDPDGNPVTGNGYSPAGGTSISAPAVTGMVALMLEQYAQTFGVNLDTAPPLPSTVRAILIQSAIDLTGTDPETNFDTKVPESYGVGPDWATGYGLADAVGSVEIVANAGFIEDQLGITDATDEFLIPVFPGQTELRVTLAWDDRAGNPNLSSVAPQLVNDLDLTVIAPGGAIHRPLVLPPVSPRDCDGDPGNGIQTGTCPGDDPGNQNYFGPAAAGIDRRNNVEQVVVEDANGLTPGDWRVRVSVLNDDGLTVRLPFGGSQLYSLVTRLPNRAPVAACSALPLTRPADDACCVEITAAEIDSGSFDPNGDADIDTICITSVDGSSVACQPLVQVCGAGAHSVTLTVTDKAGASDSCSATLLVADVTPPSITCPASVTLECPGDTDADNTGMAVATDNCSIPSIDYQDASIPGCGGTETITRSWSAVDEALNTAECSQTIDVEDTTPPDLSSTIERDNLWPPNHKLVDIGLMYDAVDACDPDPPAIVISVTSDEDPSSESGSGGAKHCPDAVIASQETVLLRAERSGGSDGRVYVTSVTATDACGNAAVAEAPVSVRKSAGGPNQSAIDSGQVYDASICGGTP